MSRWRKKPKVVEAQRFIVDDEAADAFEAGRGVEVCGFTLMKDETGFFLVIPTLEGAMRVGPGDWIITGIAGERYPCKNDIFVESYEPAE